MTGTFLCQCHFSGAGFVVEVVSFFIILWMKSGFDLLSLMLDIHLQAISSVVVDVDQPKIFA